MRLAPGSAEPAIGTWRLVEVDALVGQLPTIHAGRSRIILVDGRSAGGKTTLAQQLCTAMINSAVVHTDDVAWNYSMFDWADTLIDNIIRPVRRGEPVAYRPPGWAPHGREGAIQLPAHLDTLIIEGVGAGRRQIAHLADVLIWVQSDFPTAQERGIARDIALGTNGDPDQCRQFWDWWMAAELPFLEEEQPWARADWIVAGSDIAEGSQQRQLAVHRGPLTVAMNPRAPAEDDPSPGTLGCYRQHGTNVGQYVGDGTVSVDSVHIWPVGVSEQLVNSLKLRLVHEIFRGRILLRVAEMSLLQPA